MKGAGKLEVLSRIMSAKKRAETAKLKAITLQMQSLRTRADEARAQSREQSAGSSLSEMLAIASHQQRLEASARALETEALAMNDEFIAQRKTLSTTFGRSSALEHVIKEAKRKERCERERRAEAPPLKGRRQSSRVSDPSSVGTE